MIRDENIPMHWTTVPLSDLATVVRGASPRPKGDPRYFGGDIPWIMISDVTRDDSKVLTHTKETVTQAGAERSRLLSAGTLILTNSATIGVPKILGVDGCIHDGFVAFEGLSRCIDTDYLYEYFRCIRPQLLKQHRQGMTQVNLNTEIVRNIDVVVPPLTEQRRIVTKIEALTAKSRRAKEALDAIPALLERFRQSVLAAAFRGDLTADWRAKNPDVEPAEELLKRIRAERRRRWEEAELAKMRAKGKVPGDDRWKEKYEEPAPVDASELPELPEGWAWAPAEGIVAGDADIMYGIIQPGPVVADGVPYVRGMDIEDGVILGHQLLRTHPHIAARYARAALQGGDILLGIIRATKVAVVPPSLTGANITQGTARFRPSTGVLTDYLAGWLDSPWAQSWLHSMYRGIDMPGLNLRDVRRLPVPVAPVVEQQVVAGLINRTKERHRRLRDVVRYLLEASSRVDASILAKAFRGELVPQYPNDEPASVLLERLRAEREQTLAVPKGRAKANPRPRKSSSKTSEP